MGVDESLDTSGNVTGSDFDEDGEDPHMPFSELLSDPEKDEGQDNPSSTTGDPNEKPGKRASQGKKNLTIAEICVFNYFYIIETN